jgi:2-hydroxychromene-2-carboxylate isomerase
VLWQARAHGIALDLPQAHPFNPLGLLRLALACEAAAPQTGEVCRAVCARIFTHVWHGGAAADDPARLAALSAELAPAHRPDAPEVKAALKANTNEAISLGLFGVPTFVIDDQLFWGFDALPLLRAYLQGDAFFSGPWQAAAQVAAGVRR